MNEDAVKLRIVFAGGGTGGHLFPALAIADNIRQRFPSATITFVGTKKKIEARVVPTRGYNFEPIWISGLRRSLEPENILFPAKLVVSLIQSFLLLRRIQPQVVVGTGGYVSGPVVFMASVIGIPTMMQEQNSFPGVTTRLLAGRATEVHLAFERSRAHMKRQDNLRISGNPTRKEIGTISRSDGATAFHLDPLRKTLLILGGSLGAVSLNTAIGGIIADLMKHNIQVIWQTGVANYDRCAAAVSRVGKGTKDFIRLRKFIDRMDCAYGASDLVVCRAGATTVAELAASGIASILVPYPMAAGDHQTENAKAMVEAGASILVEDRSIAEKALETIIELMSNEEQRKRMSQAARSLANPKAAERLADKVIDLALGNNV